MARTPFWEEARERERIDWRGGGDGPGLLARVHDALGPILGGIVLDAVDFATFGPLGILVGWAAGGLAGLWLGSLYRFSLRGRVILAVVAAAYCTLPGTTALPLATIVAAVARFWGTERHRRERER